MIPKKASARSVALDCLIKWNEGKGFAETLVSQLASSTKLSPDNRHLAQAIVFGVLRNKTWIDSIIEFLRDGKLDVKTRTILQIGICQIFVMNLADHAAVNETVSLAALKTRGVINGVLRNSIRKKETILERRKNLPLHIKYSTPEWLVERWLKQFGKLNTTRLLEWNNSLPTLYVRRNPLIEYSLDLSTLIPLPGMPNWFKINGPLPIDAVKAGALYITDPSTRFAIDLLEPQPGEKILDACAAPGGKSAAIITATGGKSKLTATDLHVHRLPTLQENLSNQGAGFIETAQMDWSQPCPPCWINYFDAVLLDVPCSNTGVMQKRIDVRWRLNSNELKRLTELQYQILCNASKSVKPGGRLVYSTCSIDEDEDSNLVQRFLEHHRDFKLQTETLILPFEEKIDGAYAALLIRA